MKNISFFCPIFLGHPKARASASKASGCFTGGNPMVLRAEPGKQKPRSCRTQELARSSAQENARQKKGTVLLNRPQNWVTGESGGAQCRRGGNRRGMRVFATVARDGAAR